MDNLPNSGDDLGACEPAIKKISDALLEVAESGRTNNKTLLAISDAYLINRMSGGVVVHPWNIDDLPFEWRAAFKMIDKLPDIKKPIDEQRAMMEAAAQSNPNYRKRH